MGKRPTVRVLALLVALSTALPASLGAAPQQPAAGMPVSLERVRAGLSRPASPLLGMPFEVPVATFRTRVEQRAYVLTLEQWIDREFRLTALQRQSAAWGAKCCGLNLLRLGREVYRGVRKSLDERELRRVREEIARELARMEEARIRTPR